MDLSKTYFAPRKGWFVVIMPYSQFGGLTTMYMAVVKNTNRHSKVSVDEVSRAIEEGRLVEPTKEQEVLFGPF